MKSVKFRVESCDYFSLKYSLSYVKKQKLQLSTLNASLSTKKDFLSSAQGKRFACGK